MPKENSTSSRIVTSNQTDIHQHLERIVLKHLATTFNRPYSQHNVVALKEALQYSNGRPLIFDSGCGTGKSTHTIATEHPDHFVIGIDKSISRISRGHNRFQETSGNSCIIRADLTDVWRLAVDEGLRLAKHYILYPNPWPRSQHLKRRWHGSPLFKYLLQLNGLLELRSNWDIYVREFQQALKLAKIDACIKSLEATSPHTLTDFELKYQKSGHTLWRLTANLNTTADIDKP